MYNNPPILIITDVQPTYEEGSDTILHQVIEKVNNTDQRIICFFVGPVSSGDTKEDVMLYYLKNGMDEYKVSKIHFIEKDYGFLRNWMDKGISEEIIINSLSYMKQNQIYTSERFSLDEWKLITGNQYETNYLFREKPINYPFFHHKVFDKPEIDNFEMIGGGRFECLLEIDLYLKSLGKTTIINEDLCYGTYRPDHKKKIKTHK